MNNGKEEYKGLFLFGSIMCSVSVGFITSISYGFLTFGVLLVVYGIIGVFGRG